MKLGKYRTGQKIENADAIDSLLESWPIPDVTDTTKNLKGRSTALGMSLEDLYQKKQQQEQQEPEEEFTPPSLKEIEQIAKKPIKKGYAEGKEAGYQAGFEQGQLEGAKKGYEEGLEQGKQAGLNRQNLNLKKRLINLQNYSIN